MKFGYCISFRPFDWYQKAWFVKRYTFNTNEERMKFVCSVPKWKKRWPFDYGFYVIPDDYKE